jgi:hypothetical protein
VRLSKSRGSSFSRLCFASSVYEYIIGWIIALEEIILVFVNQCLLIKGLYSQDLDFPLIVVLVNPVLDCYVDGGGGLLIDLGHCVDRAVIGTHLAEKRGFFW